MRRLLRCHVRRVASLAVPLAAQTPAPLPMGAPVQARIDDGPTEFAVSAKTAGVLAWRCRAPATSRCSSSTKTGRSCPDGSADRDLDGNEGTELLSATITEPGDYRLRVRSAGLAAGATFQHCRHRSSRSRRSSVPSDPDRRPATAQGRCRWARPLEDSPRSRGRRQVGLVACSSRPEAGTLTVVTRQVGTGDAPDLVLECYTDGDFGERRIAPTRTCRATRPASRRPCR